MSAAVDLLAFRPLEPYLKALLLESPSLTRLEPQSVSGDPTPGLEARVHDPLWLLGRQWQLGEFQGEDAGTPVLVQVKSRALPVTAWQPGAPNAGRPALAIDPNLPLDPLIEREPFTPEQLGLRQRAEAGAYLVELLADAGLQAREALVTACPLPIDDVASEVPEQVAVPPALAIVAAATPDGVAAAAQLSAAGAPAWLDGATPEATAAAGRWLVWFRGNLAPDAATDAWVAERFEYRFGVRAGAGADGVTFDAPSHEGGPIDWHTFDHAPGVALNVPDEPAGAAVAETTATMIAAPLRFAGMPADRYWQFEDSQVNLARLDVQPHDLARLCVSEFAMVYGNDWIIVPLTVQAGTFVRISEVAYTTTFGEQFVVAAADDRARSGRFRMFAITNRDASDVSLPGLFIPPTALGALEGPALEEVVLLRDETANMAWAVERRVQARSGDPRSRGDEERPVNAVENLAPGAEAQYILQTAVPRHWIPFIPVATGVGTIALRKGTMADADLSLGVLLQPTPLTIRDEEVPREGVQVRRLPLLARATDGTYLQWNSRRTRVGRGEGWSGLAFDGAYRP